MMIQDMEFFDLESFFNELENNEVIRFNQMTLQDVNQINSNQMKFLGNDSPLYSHSTVSLPITDATEASIYNVEGFPELQDILELENVESSDFYQPLQSTVTPLPRISIQDYEDTHSDESGFHSVSSQSEEEDMGETGSSNMLTVPSRPKRRYQSGSSESSYVSSDEDGEWRPSPEKSRRSKKMPRISESSSDDEVERSRKPKSKCPTPQKRSPGTSCKMVQWIVSLLRDPKYNPSVITWQDEANGVFTIKNTVKYAKLWGEKKNNKLMNYEKLSRGMRYYYRNGELEAIKHLRLTYKFGPTATDFRALDSEDPNFTKKL